MIQHQWSGQEIAIVGMSFSLPGASDRKKFWEHLRDGVESVAPLSSSELEAAGIPREQIEDPRFVSAVGRIQEVDLFDAHFFGYSPTEAARIDPQQRLFLECAWQAVEDAGYDLARYKGIIGVFAGSKASTYTEILRGRDEGAIDFSLLGNDKDFLATTVSYKLNLTGPSVNVQTACSTALVSVFLASQALLSYQCDMALAGAVSITVPQERGYLYLENGVMSPDGHCRAFDEDARGAAPGNGVAVLVLKRLQDALRDRDYIHAIVRGAAINNDGAGKVGYSAPGVNGQAEVIAMAMAAARVGPEDISYIEAHGTGTPLGDTVEIAALTKAFRSGTRKKQYCPIGSVKTNIGHTDTVSGAAGLIKTILALRHELLPPSLNFTAPNSRINFSDSPFYVNSKLKAWKRGAVPRCAGVSSFGLGGTNAHAVIEEAPVVESASTSFGRHLLVLSARTEASLDRASEALAAYLETEPAIDIADVAYTLGVGRRAFEWRKAILCADAQRAVGALRSERTWRGRATDRRNIVFMFPGVGDHYPGMTAELYESFPQFKAEIDRCCAILQPLLGKDLRGILYAEKANHNRSRDDSGSGERTMRSLLDRSRTSSVSLNELYRTQVSHCTVFMVEYALASLWMDLGVKPAAMIGYSLGEYTAACISGVLSLEDALTAVAMRAKLLEQQPAGMMMSAAISAEQARQLLTQGLSIAAVNAPEVCVFAGTPAEINALQRRLTDEFIACRVLPVERALHSPLLKSAAAQYGRFLKTIPFGIPRIPYLSNVTGKWITDAECRDPLYWAAHTVQTVLFFDGLKELLKTPDTTFLEIGPGQSLGSFVLQHDSGPVVLSSLPYEHDSTDSLSFLLENLARIWISGSEFDWHRFYLNEKRLRVPLPTYQFDRQRYWIDGMPQPETSPARLRKKPSVADWLYAPGWKRSPLPIQQSCSIEGKNWLVFANDSNLCSAMVTFLSDAGQNIRIAVEGRTFRSAGDGVYVLDAGEPSAYRHLAEALRQEAFHVDRVLHFWTFAEEERATAEEKNAGFFSLLWLIQALSSSGQIDVDLVSSGTQEVIGSEMLVPERAMVLPLCLTASQEFPNMRFRHIDVTGWHLQQNSVAAMLQEISTFTPGLRVAYRGSHRWLQDFTSVEIHAMPSIRANGTYVITGGLGKVGLVIAEYLARRYNANLVLTGLTKLPDRSEWEVYLRQADTNDPIVRKITGLRSLDATGCNVCVVNADIADLTAMTRVFDETRAKWGQIHGVIHAAGITDAGSMRGIDETTLDQARMQLHAKLEGARLLAQLLHKYSPDFCVLMSSLSAVLGGLGMSVYAAANQYLDTMALREGRNSGTRWLSIGWDTWDVGRDSDARLTQSGLSELCMTPSEGMEAFMLLLAAAPLRQMVVSIGDLDARLKEWVAPQPSKPEQRGNAGHTRHARPNLATCYVEPRTEIEKNLAAIWSDVLGLAQVGIHDNFFQLGGHSLLGIRVTGRIQTEFGVPVHVRDIFKFPTITELSSVLLEKMATVLEQQSRPQNLGPKAFVQSDAHLVHD